MYTAFLKIKDTFNNDVNEKFFTQAGYIKLNNWHKFVQNEHRIYGYKPEEF